MALTYEKIVGGVANASSSYNDFGLAAAIGDGNNATGWSGNNTFASTVNDFVGYAFPSAQEVRKLEVYLYSWGKTIVVGFASSPTWPGTKAGFTVLRTIDTSVTPNDDLGVPWARLTKNTILLPAGNAGRAISVFTNDSGANPLSTSGSAVDRLRLMELTAYALVGTSEHTKITPISAYATSSYITYTPDKLIDGDTTTSGVWYSTPKSQGGFSQTQVIGVQFAAATAIRKIVIRLMYWSNDMVIGYSSVQPANQAGVTRLRTLNFLTTTKDDVGVTIAPGVDLTFFVPDFPASKFLSVFPLSSAVGGIGGSPVNSDFLAVYELSAYTEDPVGTVYPKLVGTVFAKDTYTGEGSLSNLVDGNTSTVWHGNSANESSYNDFLGFSFATAAEVRKLEINFSRWGRTILIGTAATIPANKAGFTTIRTINTVTQPFDDLGAPWTKLGKNTILLPAGNAAKVIGVYSNDNLGGPLSDVGMSANNTRESVFEIAAFGTSEIVSPLTQLNGTAFATSVYDSNTTFKIANLNDGGTGLYWASGNTANGQKSENQVAGLSFAVPTAVHQVKVYFDFWGKEIVFGYGPAAATAKSAFIVVRRIDTRTVTTDDAGVTIGIGKYLTFNIPLYPKSKALAVFMDTPASTGLVNMSSTTGKDYAQIRELQMFTDPSQPEYEPPVVAEIFGTAFCDKNVWYGQDSTNQPSNINDGNQSTPWRGSYYDTSANATKNFCGIKFGGLQDLAYVTATLYIWGRHVCIGTWAPGVEPDSDTFTLANIIPITTFDVVTDVDADGATITGRGQQHRINAVAQSIPGVILYTDDQRPSILNNGGAEPTAAYNNCMWLNELQVFGSDPTGEIEPPTPPVTGDNPRLPVSVPQTPFTANVANWARTEFNTAGAFSFTPAADTTLVLAVLQGAGSAGYVQNDLDGKVIPYSDSAYGGNTYLQVPHGNVAVAPGGVRQSPGTPLPYQSSLGLDWLRYLVQNGSAPPAPVAGNSNATNGTASPVGGTAGAPYALTYVNAADDGISADFTNAPGSVNYPVANQSNWARDSAGWHSTNTATSSSGYVNFQAKTYQAGTVLTFKYQTSSEGVDYLVINVGAVNILRIGGTRSATVSYTIPTTGSYVIGFRYDKDGSVNSGSDRVWVTQIGPGMVGYPLTEGGASGGRVAAFLLPQTLNFTVGKGGTGISGGQPVNVAAQGKRGAGGAGGADGGDGVVIFYEYKLPLTYDGLPAPQFATYNRNTELPGTYKTQYVGTVSNGKTTYLHRLRPRTKTVIALLVGAGGGTTQSGGGAGPYQSPPAKVSNALFSTQAESGKSPSSYGSYAAGGEPSSTINLVYSITGNGSTYYATAAKPLNGFTQGYGTGIKATQSSSYGGSDAAQAMLVLGENYFDNRILTIDVPGIGIGSGGNAAYPGAVFIYETELDYGLFVSQLAELVLLTSEIHARTQTSQVSELILQISEHHAVTQTSQVAELVLIDEPPHATTQTSQVAELILQMSDPKPITQTSQVAMLVLSRTPKVGSAVSNSILEVVSRAEPGRARVSQSIQSVLVGSERAVINASQISQMILIREDPTNIEFMDFGVVRYPTKNELYLSDTCTIASVGSGVSARIQLEGWLPLGSMLIINGEETGSLTAVVQDGDRVQLKSGVTNWFDQRLILYAYITRGNQVIRDHAGYWTMLQGDLSARKRAIISAATKYLGMKSAMAGAKLVRVTVTKQTGVAAKTSVSARKQDGMGAKTSVSASKQAGIAAKTSVSALKQAGIGATSSVSALKQAGIGAKAAMSILKDAGLSVLSNTQTAQRSYVNEAKLEMQIFQFNPVGSSYWNLQGTLARSDNHVKFANAGVRRDSNALVKPTKMVFTRNSNRDTRTQSQGWNTNLTHSASKYRVNPLILPTGIVLVEAMYTWNFNLGAEMADSVYNKLGASGFRLADMNFVHFDYAKSAVLKLVEFLAGFPQASSFYRPGYVYTPTTVSTESEKVSFTTQERDKVSTVGQRYLLNTVHHFEFMGHNYKWRSSPNRDVARAISAVAAVSVNRTMWGGFGFIDRHAPNYNSAKTEWTKRENPIKVGHDTTYAKQIFNRDTGTQQSYAKREYNANLIRVQYLIRKANIQLHGMKPILYQAGKNRIDKAKFYMGFTTQAEVNAFIVNFMKPTTKVKLDGYVYRVGVDETLVCEVRGPNMPVAWLLHGG